MRSTDVNASETRRAVRTPAGDRLPGSQEAPVTRLAGRSRPPGSPARVERSQDLTAPQPPIAEAADGITLTAAAPANPGSPEQPPIAVLQVRAGRRRGVAVRPAVALAPAAPQVVPVVALPDVAWAVTRQQAQLLVSGVKTEHRWPVLIPADMQTPDGDQWVQDIGDSPLPSWTVYRRNASVRRWSCQLTCALGSPGTLLWLQEAWRLLPAAGGRELLHWRAEPAPRGPAHTGPWRAAEELPRQFTRLLLRNASVEIRRLQAISDVDVRNEGYASRGLFREHWDRRHAAGEHWADNPWVWTVQLQRAWERFPVSRKDARLIEGYQAELDL